jgi:serine/threonine protein kinase
MSDNAAPSSIPPSNAPTAAPAQVQVSAQAPISPAAGAAPEVEHPELDGFKLIQELAKSPRGTIYKARRQVEQDIVAVKVMRAAACDRAFLDQLPKRAETTFFLEHDNIVKCLGVNSVKGKTVLVMSYAPGQPLARVLKKSSRVAPSQALIVALQCVTALRYAAQHKCSHGRLHPADIILGEDHARISGVGLGEKPEHPPWDERKAPHLFEPLIYTAPEAMPSKPALESPTAMAAADVYSLGAVLFHMLTGMPPFHGSDESALIAERDRLGIPVAWPRQTAAGLPAEIISLTEKMLSAKPAERPVYEQLVPALTVLIPIAEQAEAKAKKGSNSAVAAAKPAAPVAAAASVAPSSATGKARVVSRQGSVSVLDFPTARGGSVPNGYSSKKSLRDERFFNIVLVSVTVVALVFAATLVVKDLFFDANRQANNSAAIPPPVKTPPTDVSVAEVTKPTPKETSTEPVQAPPANPTPAPAPNAVAVPAPAPSNDENAAAARQVEKIRDMLKDGSVKPSAALLRLVDGIVGKVGHDTSAGVNALVLRAEIEEAVVRKYYGTQPNAANPANPGNPANSVAAPTEPAVNIQKPPAADTAKNEAAEKAAQAEKRLHAYDAKIQSAMSQARKYQYAPAKTEMDALNTVAQEEAKKPAQAAQEVLKQEAELFGRCHTYLKTYIEKHPQHASKIQVYPRKNDPNGDDIVDFDDKGLKIVTKIKGKEDQSHVREWKNVSSNNAFAMMQLLTDKKSLDDQIGLAAFALNRGLKEKYAAMLDSARELPGGKERADAFAALADQIVKLLTEE